MKKKPFVKFAGKLKDGKFKKAALELQGIKEPRLKKLKLRKW